MKKIIYIVVLLLSLSCRKDTDLISEKIKFGTLEKKNIFVKNKTNYENHKQQRIRELNRKKS